MNDNLFLDPARAWEITQQEPQATQVASIRAGGQTSIIWGAAWLLGFSILAATAYDWLPFDLGMIHIIVAIPMALAFIATLVIQFRAAAGLRGREVRQGTLYGLCWVLGVAVLVPLSFAVTAAVDDSRIATMLCTLIGTMTAGLLTLQGGILWLHRPMIVLGGLVLVATALGLLAGSPGYLLVLAAASLAFLVAGYAALRSAPERPVINGA